MPNYGSRRKCMWRCHAECPTAPLQGMLREPRSLIKPCGFCVYNMTRLQSYLISEYHNVLYMVHGGFLKWGYPAILVEFSIVNHPFWATPISGTPCLSLSNPASRRVAACRVDRGGLPELDLVLHAFMSTSLLSCRLVGWGNNVCMCVFL